MKETATASRNSKRALLVNQKGCHAKVAYLLSLVDPPVSLVSQLLLVLSALILSRLVFLFSFLLFSLCLVVSLAVYLPPFSKET